MGKNKGFNRQPLNTNKHLSRCSWCAQGYCRCCTNDGCDAEKYCSVFCQMKEESRKAQEESVPQPHV